MSNLCLVQSVTLPPIFSFTEKDAVTPGPQSVSTSAPDTVYTVFMSCFTWATSLLGISLSKKAPSPRLQLSKTLMMMTMTLLLLLWPRGRSTRRVWVAARHLLLSMCRAPAEDLTLGVCVCVQVYTRSVIDPIPIPTVCPDGDAASKAADRQKKKSKMSDEEIMDKLRTLF